MNFKTWIAKQHYLPKSQVSWLMLLFIPFSWLYGLAIQLRLWAYRLKWLKSYDAKVPVISIGNLTTGGTGKTPIVVELAKGLIKAGKTVVILSRGYGARQPRNYSRAIDPNYGDEAYMIQEQVPEATVIVGRDRVQTLQRAIQDYRPDYVLLDDGFQYLRLSRAMNILLIDGERLLGNERLLPAGPLREPTREIKRASIVFLTNTVTKNALQQVKTWVECYCDPKQRPQILPIEFQMAGLRPIGDFKLLQSHPTPFQDILHRPVIAFSAIANPERFEQGIEAQGFRLIQRLRFEDHHPYSARDVENILSIFQQHSDEQPILVTTDKDLPKVRPWLTEAAQQDIYQATYTLQRHLNLDGQWFYDEFITQIPGFVQASPHAHFSRHSR